jgi:hypothetical protein
VASSHVGHPVGRRVAGVAVTWLRSRMNRWRPAAGGERGAGEMRRGRSGAKDNGGAGQLESGRSGGLNIGVGELRGGGWRCGERGGEGADPLVQGEPWGSLIEGQEVGEF